MAKRWWWFFHSPRGNKTKLYLGDRFVDPHEHVYTVYSVSGNQVVLQRIDTGGSYATTMSTMGTYYQPAPVSEV